MLLLPALGAAPALDSAPAPTPLRPLEAPGTPLPVGAPPGSDRLLARLRRGAHAPALLAGLGRDAVVLEDVVSRQPLRLVLRVTGGATPIEIAGALRRSGLVDYAVPERHYPMELRSRRVPNDPLFPRQWHLDNTGQGGRVTDADVDAPEAWAFTRGSPDVVIAVLDDGIELDHADLAANIAGNGRDFTTTPPRPDARPKATADRHGTAVAGVVAARGDNGRGVAGMCPRCSILPIRVHGASNLGTAAAFRYAVEQGADVITNSWGYTREMPLAADDAVRDAIDEAARRGRAGRGTLIVFGMTNEPVDNCRGPALDISSLDSVVAVGVSDHNDALGGSGFGACMDLVAPAKPRYRSTVGIVTTDRSGLDGHASGEYHASFGGTSAAAPLVAGAAGLLLSLNPDLTREEVRRILEHTADKIDPAAAGYDAHGFSDRAGYGRVNAARALVPHAKIDAAPRRVEAGEPFAVTVTASAPYGLASVSWSGLDTGIAELDAPRVRRVAGGAFHTASWPGLVIDRPGTYVLAAEALDARHADPVDGYSHAATRAGGPATVTITVLAPAAPAAPAGVR